MRQRQTILDRIATLAALRLLAWVGKRIDPAQHLWLEALRAELDAIDGGIARLVWAVGGLRLVWFERRRYMLNATYRYGPVLLPWLEVALFVGLLWSLIQHYGSLVVRMIYALLYEPRDQRQRFEPREQQGIESGQRQRR